VPDLLDCQRQFRREYLVDYRPGPPIRIARHFYFIDDELDLIIRDIRKIDS